MTMRKLQMDELNRVSKETYKKLDKLPVIIILDNIRSLSNIGSVFRTADAFRIKELLLCGITACPPHREIHKTALGADESVDWRYFETTDAACRWAKEAGYQIYAVEQIEGSTMLQEFDIKPNTAYILGNEVDGVSEEALSFCDGAVELPQEGTKHSLNISVCAGIIMWKIFERLVFNK